MPLLRRQDIFTQWEKFPTEQRSSHGDEETVWEGGMSSAKGETEEDLRKGLRGGLRQEEPGGEIRSWPVRLNQTRSHSVAKWHG